MRFRRYLRFQRMGGACKGKVRQGMTCPSSKGFGEVLMGNCRNNGLF